MNRTIILRLFHVLQRQSHWVCSATRYGGIPSIGVFIGICQYPGSVSWGLLK